MSKIELLATSAVMAGKLVSHLSMPCCSSLRATLPLLSLVWSPPDLHRDIETLVDPSPACISWFGMPRAPSCRPSSPASPQHAFIEVHDILRSAASLWEPYWLDRPLM